MRKEENLDLLKKLAVSKIDTGLMKSSRSLGATKTSNREVLTRALKETQAGINVEKNEKLLFESKPKGLASSSESDEPDYHDQSLKVSSDLPTLAPAVGGGLKRPLESDADGNPILKQRKRVKKVASKFHSNDFDSWSGISSDSESKGSSHSVPSDTTSDPTHSNSDLDVESGSDMSYSDDEVRRKATEDRKARSSAFKAWATSQVNEALDFTPASAITPTEAGDFPAGAPIHQIKPREPDIDPLPPELRVRSEDPNRRTFYVGINRPEKIQAARMELPILAEEQRIMEAIHNNPTVVICGETGSGKTTQVPQFLYEAGFGQEYGPNPGMIGVTQPRRVAAVSMAGRVGAELSGEHIKKVAHQIRFASSVSRDTLVKFMTDGVLVREIAKDFVLSRYSVIIVDEAHERSTNTDILIGLLTRIVDLRESMRKEDQNKTPLKLVIMSATLRIQDFLENKTLFRDGPPPLVQIEGRQHPVTVHFARRTQSDYVEQAFSKVCRGHRLLPPGGILVFLTGQDEIISLSRRLSDAFLEFENETLIIASDTSEDEDETDFQVEHYVPSKKAQPVHVLPLYSQLNTDDQLRVFEPPPESSRLIVLATNVAETSLTIPGIRYVFDCGRAKEKVYDKTSGVQSFEVGWISKASASQRAGRAGRTGPGHCYRLYSSAIYERDFEEHAAPEILRMPAEEVVLQLKSMELHNVAGFPFPTPPDRRDLAKAEKLLMHLGALSIEGRITPTGRELSAYPISPRYAKMLAVGHQFNCMAFTIILVAALATPNMFIPENLLGLTVIKEPEIYTNQDRVAEEIRTKRRSDYNHAQHLCSKHSRTSDGLKAFTALQGYMKANDKEEYLQNLFLSPKSMQEASNLVVQLTSIASNTYPLHLSSSTPQLSSPSKDQIAALQQFMVVGFLDQIAILASDAPSPPFVGRNPKRAIDVPYLPLFSIKKARRTSGFDIQDVAVYIHPSSILAHVPVQEMPKYIVYSYLQRATPATIEGAKKPRTRMHALTTVTDKTMAVIATGTPLLEYGKPLSILEETNGPKGKTRTCIVQPSLVGEKESLGWPLPAQKVVQVKNPRGEWIIE